MPDLLSEITQTAKAYYAQASAFPLTATDFYDWLESLPTARKTEVMAHGFRAGRSRASCASASNGTATTCGVSWQRGCR